MNRGVITISESGTVSMPTDTVWMTMQEIADMYNVFGCYVRKAVKAVFKDGILKEQGVRRHVRKNDRISYDVYSLELVIAVAFRIDSIESRAFREFIMQSVIGRQTSRTKLVCIFTENAMAQTCRKATFLGRLDDISTTGINLIEDIVTIFDNYGLDTEIIAASVRNPIHVTDCALAGAHIATVPYKVIEQMTKHPLTDQGIEKFQADYKAVFGE